MPTAPTQPNTDGLTNGLTNDLFQLIQSGQPLLQNPYQDKLNNATDAITARRTSIATQLAALAPGDVPPPVATPAYDQYLQLKQADAALASMTDTSIDHDTHAPKGILPKAQMHSDYLTTYLLPTPVSAADLTTTTTTDSTSTTSTTTSGLGAVRKGMLHGTGMTLAEWSRRQFTGMPLRMGFGASGIGTASQFSSFGGAKIPLTMPGLPSMPSNIFQTVDGFQMDPMLPYVAQVPNAYSVLSMCSASSHALAEQLGSDLAPCSAIQRFITGPLQALADGIDKILAAINGAISDLLAAIAWLDNLLNQAIGGLIAMIMAIKNWLLSKLAGGLFRNPCLAALIKNVATPALGAVIAQRGLLPDVQSGTLGDTLTDGQTPTVFGERLPTVTGS